MTTDAIEVLLVDGVGTPKIYKMNKHRIPPVTIPIEIVKGVMVFFDRNNDEVDDEKRQIYRQRGYSFPAIRFYCLPSSIKPKHG